MNGNEPRNDNQNSSNEIELFSTASPDVVSDLTRLWLLQAQQKSALHPLYQLGSIDLESTHNSYLEKYQHEENFIVLMNRAPDGSIVGYMEIWILAFSPISAIDQLAHIHSYYFPNARIRDQNLSYMMEILRSRVEFVFLRLDITQTHDLQIFQEKGFVCVQERLLQTNNHTNFSSHPSSIVIHEAEDDDFPQIIPLWKEQWKFHERSRSQFQEIYTLNENAEQIWLENAQKEQKTYPYKVFVAKKNEDIIAYAEAYTYPYSSRYIYQNYGVFDNIHVLPTYRRQGIGQSLFRALQEEFLGSSFSDPVMVTVDNQNIIAQNFWRELGFKQRQKHLYFRIS